MKVKHWPNKAEWKEIRNQFRNQKVKDPCFLMDQQQFNKLLFKYKQLKPGIDHKKAIRYLRFIINEYSGFKESTTDYCFRRGPGRADRRLDTHPKRL